ncbi:MAG: type IV secretory system conjugative DNA transfer family protein [Streptosporangiaceae bacterium]
MHRYLVLLAVLVLIVLCLRILKARTIGHLGESRNRPRMIRWRIRLRMRPGPGFASATELTVRWSRLRCVISGKRSRPSLPLWARLVSPATMYGVRLGRAQWGRRTFGRMEDQTLVIAPPRSGKSGALADRIMDHPGPCVVTTTRADLYDLTAAHRAALGPIEWFNPLGIGGLGSSVRWDVVTGCEDPMTAIRRAQALTGAVPDGDLAEWIKLAGSALAALLHAAAIGGRTILDVYGWANRYLEGEPEEILATIPGASAELLKTLATIQGDSRTAGSIRTTMTKSIDWVAVPALAEAVTPEPGTGFEIRSWVNRSGTLYLIAPDAAENSPVGPLFRALAEEIHYVAGLAGSCGPHGRLDPPLLFALDEVCQVCPVPLPSWMADSAGKGILIVAVAHGIGQLEARYGKPGAAAIWETSGVKLLLGGIDDDELLSAVSRVCGQVDVRRKRGDDTFVSVPVVPPEVLRTLADFRALVLRTNLSPCVVKLRMAWKRRDFRKAPRPAFQHTPVFPPAPALPGRAPEPAPFSTLTGAGNGHSNGNGHAHG